MVIRKGRFARYLSEKKKEEEGSGENIYFEGKEKKREVIPLSFANNRKKKEC